MKVDLNSDLGEGAGHDDEILSLVSSANIACGFHAGNPAGIFNSIRAAKEKGVAVGAHPSLDDRKNFGRTEMQVGGGGSLRAGRLSGWRFSSAVHGSGAEDEPRKAARRPI
jgi:hypothetical protein